MNRIIPVLGLPRLLPELRSPIKTCNTCRFERTPTAQAPCDTCVDTPQPSQWRPK